MADDTTRTDTDQPLARDDGPRSEDQDTASTYTPFAVEFAAGAG